MKTKPLIIAVMNLFINKRRFILSSFWFLVTGCILMQGCSNSNKNKVKVEELTYKGLAAFSSEEDFNDYLRSLRDNQKRQSKSSGSSDNVATEAAIAPAQASPPSDTNDGATESSITNNQEVGVDEGDIIKAYRDYLVILRRGRLFVVKTSNGLQKVAQLPSYFPGLHAVREGYSGAWYDELLIHENLILVIGYNYRFSATEIGLFRISEDGQVSHENSYFLYSNDYYSSRNYASRLVASKLVFYMPYHLRFHDSEVGLPAISQYESEYNSISTNTKSTELPRHDIIQYNNIYRPVQPTLNPTLHTVVVCDLTQSNFSCTARAILGPYSRRFYVTTQAVYIWVASGYCSFCTKKERETWDRYSTLYRFPFDGGESPKLIQLYGSPIDQFSFHDDGEYLNVLLRGTASRDWMWHSEWSTGKVVLARIPLSALSTTPATLEEQNYHILPSVNPPVEETTPPASSGPETPVSSPISSSLLNRFVGNHLLYGGHYYHPFHSRPQQSARLFVLPYRRPANHTELELTHRVERIDRVGTNAVVMGNQIRDTNSLEVSIVELGESPRLAAKHVILNASQSERRSHSYHHTRLGDGQFLMGIPVVSYSYQRQNQNYLAYPLGYSGYSRAGIEFLLVQNTQDSSSISSVGALSANVTTFINDNCIVSCTDWYGNARPIFWRNRILALVGYELMEGQWNSDRTSLDRDRHLYFLDTSR